MGRKSQHRIALLRNLVRALVTHKRIQTTLIKAKEASAYSDRMVELAKKGDLHARRQLISRVGCVKTTDLLIKQIAPAFKDRKGGYTRVLRLSKTRVGDGAETAILEFTVPFEMPVKKARKKKAGKADAKAETPETPLKKSKEKKETKGKAKDVSGAKSSEEPEVSSDAKKESEKKGGFLGTLRKFLKGDE